MSASAKLLLDDFNKWLLMFSLTSVIGLLRYLISTFFDAKSNISIQACYICCVYQRFNIYSGVLCVSHSLVQPIDLLFELWKSTFSDFFCFAFFDSRLLSRPACEGGLNV